MLMFVFDLIESIFFPLAIYITIFIFFMRLPRMLYVRSNGVKRDIKKMLRVSIGVNKLIYSPVFGVFFVCCNIFIFYKYDLLLWMIGLGISVSLMIVGKKIGQLVFVIYRGMYLAFDNNQTAYVHLRGKALMAYKSFSRDKLFNVLLDFPVDRVVFSSHLFVNDDRLSAKYNEKATKLRSKIETHFEEIEGWGEPKYLLKNMGIFIRMGLLLEVFWRRGLNKITKKDLFIPEVILNKELEIVFEKL
jgi:hypothetical protein